MNRLFGNLPVIAPAAFSPSDLPNLVLWLNASTLALNDNDTVATWNDSSGLGNNASQSNSAKRPIYKASSGPGGKPSVQFDGTNYCMAGNTSITGTTLTAFAVLTMSNTTSDYGRALSLGATGNPDYNSALYCVAIGRNDLFARLYAFRNNSNGSQANVSYDTGYVFDTIFDGVNNTSYLNGTAQASAASAGTFGIANYGLGGDVNGTTFWAGYISEIVVYSSALSNTDRAKVEQYLGTKYGISIP
jgi:hypothetical protein